MLTDGSRELGGTISLQGVFGVKPDDQTAPIAISGNIVILLMGWQQEEVVKLSNEQNKQIHPDG